MLIKSVESEFPQVETRQKFFFFFLIIFTDNYSKCQDGESLPCKVHGNRLELMEYLE